MSNNFFCKSFFRIQYILKSQVKAITLAGTYSTEYYFIDKKFVEIICQVFESKPQCLIKFKQI